MRDGLSDIKTLWEYEGYDSAHEHCDNCGDCLFYRDEVVKIDYYSYVHASCPVLEEEDV